MVRLIKQCIVAKDAWEILKTAHEGTTKVKSARLQLLTTKFENLRMMEYESIHDYHLILPMLLTPMERKFLMKSLLGKFSDLYLRGLT